MFGFTGISLGGIYVVADLREVSQQRSVLRTLYQLYANWQMTSTRFTAW